MTFVLKHISEEEDYTPPMVFRSKIKIGSSQDCDICIQSESILSLHCEIYPYANEHRIVGLPSARITVNDKEPQEWPYLLNDGDIISFSGIKYRFHILHDVMRRSWKASFSANAALVLIAVLIIFEISIIFWLPYELKSQKETSFASLKQETFLYIDNLRAQTRGLDTGDDPIQKSIKNALLGIENDMAIYVRKYRDTMGWDETRTIYKDLHAIGNIVQTWPKLKELYASKLTISPDVFVNNLVKNIELKFSSGQTDNIKMEQNK